ncbi:hypothetical protein ABZ746_19270 [Streptomyces sp. NPDC020096]
MKHGTIRTLGAAALGVAFAAAAAGSANAAETAAPSALPAVNPATALDGLPVQQATNLLPGAGPAVQQAQGTLRSLAAPDGNGLLGGLKPGSLPISSVTGALGAAGH